MPQYDQNIIANHFNAADNGATNAARGAAFEDLICYLFDLVPGVEITQRNQMNAYATEEIDVAVWNDRPPRGLHFLPNIILIECKNWRSAVSSIEVNWFASKLEHRGRDFGILIANNGITGNQQDLDRAHFIIATHMQHKRQIVVINRAEITQLQNTNDLIRLIKEKLCILAVAGTLA